ncbi:MAG: response regulator [Candidatus Omnitrophota bacterium]
MKKILVVEDNKIAMEMIKTILESEGFQIIEATDGFEGYEKTKEEKPDLIITDVVMPEVNGYEFSRLIKSDSNLCNIPIVIVSACKKSEHDIMIGKQQCEAEAYITIPFDPQVLIKTVNGLLPKAVE